MRKSSLLGFDFRHYVTWQINFTKLSFESKAFKRVQAETETSLEAAQIAILDLLNYGDPEIAFEFRDIEVRRIYRFYFIPTYRFSFTHRRNSKISGEVKVSLKLVEARLD